MTGTRQSKTYHPHQRILVLALLAASGCSQPPPVIENGTEISLEYTAKTADGAVVDANPEGQPIVFVVGAGMLRPKVEAQLVGMRKGDEKTFAIPEAYGAYDGSKTGLLPLDALPAEANVGDEIPMAEGFPAKIKDFRDNMVVLDLNHPLAGKEITFEVRVVEVGRPKAAKKDAN